MPAAAAGLAALYSSAQRTSSTQATFSARHASPVCAGLFRPDSGTAQVLPPYAFVFQNPDHQVVMPTVAADVAFGLGRWVLLLLSLVSQQGGRAQAATRWVPAAAGRVGPAARAGACLLSAAALPPPRLPLNSFHTARRVAGRRAGSGPVQSACRFWLLQARAGG